MTAVLYMEMKWKSSLRTVILELDCEWRWEKDLPERLIALSARVVMLAGLGSSEYIGMGGF